MSHPSSHLKHDWKQNNLEASFGVPTSTTPYPRYLQVHIEAESNVK